MFKCSRTLFVLLQISLLVRSWAYLCAPFEGNRCESGWQKIGRGKRTNRPDSRFSRFVLYKVLQSGCEVAGFPLLRLASLRTVGSSPPRQPRYHPFFPFDSISVDSSPARRASSFSLHLVDRERETGRQCRRKRTNENKWKWIRSSIFTHTTRYFISRLIVLLYIFILCCLLLIS